MDEADARYLYRLYITNCVFNAFIAYAAIMLNIVTIQAIRKTSSLPKPLKTLLLSLAVSDLGVGLVVEPLYIGFLAQWSQKNTASNSTVEIAFSIALNIFISASFFSVLAISVDRFLAIHLHLRYQELVTHKRVIAAVISIWILSLFLSLINMWTSSHKITFAYIVIFGVCFIFTTIVYWKVYLAVKRHRNQIGTLQVQEDVQNDEITNFTMLRKSATSTFYVCFVFLICYLPQYCMTITSTIVQESDITVTRVYEGFNLYSESLLLFNSSLNPIIYCWKMRHIRQAIVDILRNALRKYNRGK